MKRKTTKDILAESFLELSESNRIDKIRISDITDNCGMSAPTFYNHFKDKYDIMVWIYVRDVKPIISKIGDAEHDWKSTLFEAAEYYWNNKGFVVNALKHTSGHDAFLFLVQKINTEHMVAAVRKRLMTEHLSDEIMGLIKVYVYGTVNLMLEWLLGKNGYTAEQIVDIWDKSLPELLRQYISSEKIL
ncbi:MAG: TetR/AcrR family transcriptional regulator C-terminal domain-containing protein [Ruminococcus sp.]|nr:TetR/AcrR family transcriptional regulator C-terminal domain-containing protein [Ruminococcus sp.]